MSDSRMSNEKGVSLIEVVMVTLIIAAIVAIVVPGYSRQKTITAASSSRASLEYLRTAYQLFYEEENRYPNTGLTDLYDGTAPSGRKYIAAIPKEAIMGKNTVISSFNGQGGWIHDMAPPRKILLNVSGPDSDGVAYLSY